MQRLLAYHWPGNVRELIHVIERAAVLCGGEVIDVGDLPGGRARRPRARRSRRPERRRPVAARARSRALEKQLILRALERAKGNRSAAARQLGIGRPQLYAKLEEHGLGGPRGDGTSE